MSDPTEPPAGTEFPDAWTVWSQGDDGRLVLAYRPDVFDGDEFPAACLPTLYLTHGKRTRRPGTNPTTTGASDWFVTFYLEPDVTLEGARRFSTRGDALERCRELARAFDDGEIDYRDCYQVPRERYFEKLDELTGRELDGRVDD
ncbi:hypothetical protein CHINAEXTREME_17815 [Halobiforma lacisalsi AJ5]|uniref:Uncharacterized protein n=1 Tax=Natronobacterium lacisalsi AJ5 TaxID=358396 RepID=M0LDI2_NATLA|nr:DUF5820 family protein [Halobiforma lacisalsi]APW99509.1 hypothetical protein CHINAEXTREME_17815 [Halobiforma lacisalsi AJ5]EMA31632.1 hypothetical protein C445_14157 [Halobiforma lacisalsi AJ5]